MPTDAMYQAFVEVIPTSKGFERSLSRQLDGPMASAGSTGGAAYFGGMQGSMKSLLLRGGGILGGIGLASALGDAFVTAIDDASTYQQASQAVEDVYGRLGADAIRAFAESGAETVGQSMNDILQSASVLGLIGKNAGLAGEDLEDFTESIITLGADLSAFANTSPEEAVQAIMASFRGEADPLEKYGVFLNDAALKQKALELGIYDGNGALSAQQRILAAYGVLMDSTTAQQGAFAGQADTLAGKQTELAAKLENTSTKIGEALLPTITELADYMLTKGVPALEDFAAWFQDPATQQGIEGIGGVIKGVGDLTIGLGTSFADTSGMIGGVAGFLNGDLSFDEFKGKLTELPGFWGMVFRAAEDAGTKTGAAVGTMIWRVKQFAADVGTNIGNAVAWFQSLPSQIGTAVGNAGSWLYNTGRDLVQGFVNGITSKVSSIIAAVQNAVGGAIEFARNLLDSHSPSRVFIGLGEDTAMGYALGIASEYGAVRAATAGMTSAAVEGANARSLEMNVYAAPGMDESALVRKAVRAIEEGLKV